MSEKHRVGPETTLRLLAVHVTNVAVVNQQMLNDRQRKLIEHSARILRDVANMLSPPKFNPRQRWDKLEEKRAAREAVAGPQSTGSEDPHPAFGTPLPRGGRGEGGEGSDLQPQGSRPFDRLRQARAELDRSFGASAES